ncbi:hypothetical protein BS47DRAFT_1359875 [Hydnum rufescens UP504]|uniref:DUF6534 domain-containing protein n=1 Tax=Hydnum rufescens UP504 TaxID=1448309 RepID=A0A9P6DZK9_9AGAM|nr:hypothetical protein BS47DRAFT_1359875 [Hydnum rufescens UP504]
MVIPSNTFGGTFIGDVLAAVCFGVLTIQTASYYHAFPNDKRPLKLAVGFLCACVTQSLYWWFVTNYNNPLALQRATWEFGTYQIHALRATSFEVCASFTVQTFFAYRLYSISSNLYVGVLVCSVQVSSHLRISRLSATYCIPIKWMTWLAAATGVKANILLEFQVIVKECTWLVEVWLTIQAIADVVIATLINRMVLYTINTGLVTSILSCIGVGLFAKYGFHFSVVAVGLAMGSCYSISMLANLHMRTTLRTRLAAPGALELINYAPKKRKRQSTGDYGGESFTATRIHVTTEVVCNGDIDPTVRIG